ncbi:MAG TPA: potassium-transporting ATPase subunit KdpA [Verrucomicrobiae bacterium]|jgi:K+-transporting ATPase ATPase A chain|nr:potassium-transporting ATPase subunit KdpA [Verrucomicrobiae bacterium]
MKVNEIIQIVLFFGIGIALTPLLGRFMARVFKGERTILHPLLAPVENFIYRLSGVDPAEEMHWLNYFWAVLVFTLVGFASLMVLLMTQQWLPLNPQKIPNCTWHLAFNTAWSFACNADWQSYSGESTMSYFSQTIGLSVHQFLSGAGGLAVLVAVGRALKRASAKTIGNFWVDLTRALLYIVIPFSILWAIPLAWQGVPQTWKPYTDAQLVEPYTTQVAKLDDKGQPVLTNGVAVMVDQRVTTQSIPAGPVASFESCKQLFTNGGGYYGVNSAHPLENPTPLSNFLELLAIIVFPMAQVYMFGLLIGNVRHAWCLYAVMLTFFVASFAIGWYAETRPNPIVQNLSPPMEGKEQRFGVMNSVLWGVACTAIDNGSVNSMHDSWMPLAGMMPMWNILVGEIIFGGIGCGMYCLLFHILIAVFIAGLMIGRTPEYLGKKLGAWEASWAVVGVLLPSVACLIPAAISCMIPAGLSSMNNGGPHGLSEVLYAFGEAANNNGSAFAGLNANTPWYNVALGIAIVIGRFAPIVAALAIVGRLASRKTVEASAGTLPTHGWTFGLTLAGVIVIVAALTFFPVLCLGPIVEHGLMLAGRTF